MAIVLLFVFVQGKLNINFKRSYVIILTMFIQLLTYLHGNYITVLRGYNLHGGHKIYMDITISHTGYNNNVHYKLNFF